MHKHTIETAATAVVVASLVFGMVLSVPSNPLFPEVETVHNRTTTPNQTAFGLLKQPERF